MLCNYNNYRYLLVLLALVLLARLVISFETLALHVLIKPHIS